jgi:hypothetical protein
VANRKAVYAPWISEIRMVKEIERIRAEPHVDSLGHFGVLDQRHIQVRQSGAIEIAETVCSRHAERRRGIGNSLSRITADLHRTDQIQANRAADVISVDRGQNKVERIAALYCEDRRQFPSVHEAVAFEGQIVNGIRYESMPASSRRMVRVQRRRET